MIKYFDENTLWVCVPEGKDMQQMQGGNPTEITIDKPKNINTLFSFFIKKQVDTDVNGILNDHTKKLLKAIYNIQKLGNFDITKNYKLDKFVINFKEPIGIGEEKTDDGIQQIVYESGVLSELIKKESEIHSALMQGVVPSRSGQGPSKDDVIKHHSDKIYNIELRISESLITTVTKESKKKSGLLSIFRKKESGDKAVTETKKVWIKITDPVQRDALLEEYWNLWKTNFNELLPKQSQYDDDEFEKFKKQRLTEPEYIEILTKTPGVELDQTSIAAAAKMFSYHFTAVDIFKKTAATYNNDMSSRSHLFYEIKLESVVGSLSRNDSSKYHTIIICDLAGKEDVISAEKMKLYFTEVWARADQEQEKRKKNKELATPYTEQRNYIIAINEKYRNRPKSKSYEEMYPNSGDDRRRGEEIFPGDGKKNIDVSYIDENHPYILDLRGEGRMINSTLENLQSQLKGNNNYMAPLNDVYSFFKSQSTDNAEVRFNIKQNKFNFRDSGGISEEYKLYGKILEREYNVLKLPPLADEIIKKPNLNAPLWVNVNKLLETKISELTDGNINIEWQVLLAINLNDRSKTTNIDYNVDLNSLKQVKIQEMIDTEYTKFMDAVNDENRDLKNDADIYQEVDKKVGLFDRDQPNVEAVNLVVINKLKEENVRRNEGGKEEFDINDDYVLRLINQKVEEEVAGDEGDDISQHASPQASPKASPRANLSNMLGNRRSNKILKDKRREQHKRSARRRSKAVSYTHLTLPTKA